MFLFPLSILEVGIFILYPTFLFEIIPKAANKQTCAYVFGISFGFGIKIGRDVFIIGLVSYGLVCYLCYHYCFVFIIIFCYYFLLVSVEHTERDFFQVCTFMVSCPDKYETEKDHNFPPIYIAKFQRDRGNGSLF